VGPAAVALVVEAAEAELVEGVELGLVQEVVLAGAAELVGERAQVAVLQAEAPKELRPENG
jgi:hypothetical protein